MLETLSELWRLYRLAQTHALPAFRDRGLRIASRTLGFDGAVWGEGQRAPTGGVQISHAVLFHQPSSLLNEYAELPVADPVSTRFAQEPGRVQFVDVDRFYASASLAPVRHYLLKHRVRHLMLLGLEHPAQRRLQWLTLYRYRKEHAFDEQDARRFQQWLPHLIQAENICRLLHTGESAISAEELTKTLRVQRIDESSSVSLSRRQGEVLHYFSLGYNYQETAAQMGIKALTVKEYASDLYAKLGVKNKAEAIFEARVLGLLR
jgi:DNA-binding CsgD family transcriptional regulator